MTDTDSITHGIVSMTGVAVMGGIAMKTVDMIGKGPGRRTKRKRKH